VLDSTDSQQWAQEAIKSRIGESDRFFADRAKQLASISHQCAERLRKGGRLLTFGRGVYATDAQHLSVEFIHPVIVGKRSLPALDLSDLSEDALVAIARPEDIVAGFGPPNGDGAVERKLSRLAAKGCLPIAFQGAVNSDSSAAIEANQRLNPACDDLSVYRELIEVAYHTLWETVHVFLERHSSPVAHGVEPSAKAKDLGAAGFLYPFLSQTDSKTPEQMFDQVEGSIGAKATETNRLIKAFSDHHLDHLIEIASRITERIEEGRQLLIFGNGGSATDANDLALALLENGASEDAAAPAPTAISLAREPAVLSALANDVGIEAVFSRQLAGLASPFDVAIGFSTSGGSLNLIEAFEEASKRDLLTMAILGHDGGEIVRRKLVDYALVVDSVEIPRIQEVQATIYHLLVELINQQLERSAAAFHGVQLFGSSSCPHTAEMRDDLDLRGIKFTEFDVETNLSAYRRLQNLTNGQSVVPVLATDAEVTRVGWHGRTCPASAPSTLRPNTTERD